MLDNLFIGLTCKSDGPPICLVVPPPFRYTFLNLRIKATLLSPLSLISGYVFVIVSRLLSFLNFPVGPPFKLFLVIPETPFLVLLLGVVVRVGDVLVVLDESTILFLSFICCASFFFFSSGFSFISLISKQSHVYKYGCFRI